MTPITDNIAIGNSHDARTGGVGWNAVLNCAIDLNGPNWEYQQYLVARCGLIDGPGNHPAAYCAAVFALHALLKSGKKVLVHCHEGKSRSVAVVVMYLHATDHEARGWDYWLEVVKSKRTEANPHEAHRTVFPQIDWAGVRSIITVE